jgi:hypothetical protein
MSEEEVPILTQEFESGVTDNEQLDWPKAKYILKKTGLLMSNLSFVYFFEYSITTSFGIQAVTKMCVDNPACATDGSGSYAMTNAFTILYFCYQVGVFFSRSSLNYFVIERNWIVTVLQFINFFLLFLNAFFVYVKSVYILYIWFIWVGCMGGSSYVNVIYKIKNSPKLEKTERELAVMMLMVFNDVGIFSASVLALILSTTIWKS